LKNGLLVGRLGLLASFRPARPWWSSPVLRKLVVVSLDHNKDNQI
jgi:hypothetical protein